MTTSDWILILNGIAILLAPLVALWIGGILQRRSDAYKAKLSIFATLVGLRHTPLSADLVRALNQIDAVFVDDQTVREAWTRYLTTLDDANLSTPFGVSMREEKRRELLLEIVKTLGLAKKISSADLLRTYFPSFVAEEMHVTMLERLHKRAALEADLSVRNIAFPPCPVPLQRSAVPSPIPLQPGGPTTGDGVQQPLRFGPS